MLEPQPNGRAPPRRLAPIEQTELAQPLDDIRARAARGVHEHEPALVVRRLVARAGCKVERRRAHLEGIDALHLGLERHLLHIGAVLHVVDGQGLAERARERRPEEEAHTTRAIRAHRALAIFAPNLHVEGGVPARLGDLVQQRHGRSVDQ